MTNNITSEIKSSNPKPSAGAELRAAAAPINKKSERTLKDVFIPNCLEAAGLSWHEHRVFCRVACRGECYESIDSMAEGCGMHRDTVRKALKSLVEVRGFLEREKHPGFATHYRVKAIIPFPQRPVKRRGTPRVLREGSKPETNVPSPKNVPSFRDRKETGALRCPSSSFSKLSKPQNIDAPHKPHSVHDVLIHALTRETADFCAATTTSRATDWVSQFDFSYSKANRTGRDIIEGEPSEAVREALTKAFRFLHWNNRAGWNLEHNWRANYDGFELQCEDGACGQGPAEVPLNWLPHICGVDGWPEDETEVNQLPF
jgi:hypothetical protein